MTKKKQTEASRPTSAGLETKPLLISGFEKGKCPPLAERGFNGDAFSKLLMYHTSADRNEAETHGKERERHHSRRYPDAGFRVQCCPFTRNHNEERFWGDIKSNLAGGTEVAFDRANLPGNLVEYAEQYVAGSAEGNVAFNSYWYEAIRDLLTQKKIDEQDFLRGGVDPATKDLITLATESLEPVLIVGETGIGKTRLARHIHESSLRKKKPFVPENIAGIPAELLESTLFGILPGAATGVAERKGLMKLAEGGTILLDEIGELDTKIQSKLLKVIQQDRAEARFYPVGSDRQISVDVRVIAGTNIPMKKALAEGKFREDLFHRFSIVIELPSLKERIERDREILEELFNAFHVAFQLRYFRTIDRGFEFPAGKKDCFDLLACGEWPGNIRQYCNVCQDLFREAYFLEERGPARITPQMVERRLKYIQKFYDDRPAIPTSAQPGPESPETGPIDPLSIMGRIEDLKRQAVELAAREGNNVISRGAKLYGCQYRTFERKMREFGLKPKKRKRKEG